MREPEFLPTWYFVLLRRRKAVWAQAWITAVITAALAVWALIGQKQTHRAELRLAAVQTELNATGIDLQHLADIEAIKRELEQQARIVRRLGVHVPASRMMAALAELMPPQMALLDLQVRTEETAAPQTDAERARGADVRIGRRLRLSVTGLAPSEEELATFLTKLVAVPYFAEVELVKAEDHSEESRLMRRFEVKFALNLDDAAAVASVSDSNVASGGGR